MIKMYLTDERFLVYEDDKQIFDNFPAIISSDEGKYEIVPTLEIYRKLLSNGKSVKIAFFGGVVSNYEVAELLLKISIKNKKKWRPKCRIAIFPGSASIEIRAIKSWYHKWYDRKEPELVWEPIAFFTALAVTDGFLATLRSSMLEITEVRNNTIKRHIWKPLQNNLLCQSYHRGVVTTCIKDTVLNHIKKFIASDNSLPVFFTSYNDLRCISYVDFNRYNARIIKYDEFCRSIIDGLDESPLIDLEIRDSIR